MSKGTWKSKEKRLCLHKGERECFNSTEIKGKSSFICKNCGKYLGTIYPIENIYQYDGEEIK